MAVPKRKKSKSARDMRRAQHKIQAVQSQACPQCKEAKRPHCVCKACGYYDGRLIVLPRPSQEAA